MNYKVALAQINPTVGDIDGNTEKIIAHIRRAREKGADLVVFPELAITGYPPKDLLLKPSFVRDNMGALDLIIAESGDIAVVVGFVDAVAGAIHNAAAVIRDRKLTGVQHKSNLPNYDVFDEKRYFEPGLRDLRFELDGNLVNVNICEDIWVEETLIEAQSKKPDLIVNISASPFYAGKSRARRELIARRAEVNRVPIVHVNLVGGQDDLVFDGRSYVFSKDGTLIAEGKQFEEDLVIVDMVDIADMADMADGGYEGGDGIVSEDDLLKEIYGALLLGIKDYVRKNGFEKVVIGLSGGIDSAVTTALATEALGAQNVVCVSMPSVISSKSGRDDAERLAENLGVEYRTIPIAGAVDAYAAMLSDEFRGTEAEGVAEENIQARIRGNILMALSNKFGYLVLSTGNKSELAVGYCTLYGDMSGGLAVISDVLKTTVYKLARYINTVRGTDGREGGEGGEEGDEGERGRRDGREVIPESIIIKEPSAELRVGQKDTDSLPPYEMLDPILQAYIEEERAREDIIEMGFDRGVVNEIIRMVDHSEYKRQQAPIGIKITPKAFGSGRRMPITNRYEGK